MKDSLHRLAQRAGLGTLRQQLTTLFAALLTLSLGVYTVYVGDEQVEFIERLERQHADELTHALAAALEPDLASGNTASATRHLLKLDDNPHIRRATVTDRQGVPLASVARRGERAQIAVEPPGDTPIPLPDSARRAAQGATGNGSTHFIAWAGIGGDAPLGWLRIEVAPVAGDNLHHIIVDSLIAAIVTLIAGTLVIRHVLRPPLRRVQLKYPHRFRPRLPHRFRRKPLRPYLHKFLRHLPPRRKLLPLHPPSPHSLQNPLPNRQISSATYLVRLRAMWWGCPKSQKLALAALRPPRKNPCGL